MNRPVIVVHGGAWYIPDHLRADYCDGCRRAALEGWSVLQKASAALDAVEAAVRVLEDDVTFDAGRGSYLNQAGEVEMDAIIMDGRTLNLGAVAAVQQVRHPITLARRVLDLPAHSFVVGRGAEALAWEMGIPRCSPDELQGKAESPNDDDAWLPPGFDLPSDTVGAVALDEEGNLAVATSTGGTPNKLPGRVGDSPLVGCGAYADNDVGAAVATGWGERLMRIVTSKTACDLLAQGASSQEAADAVIALLESRAKGYGGVIILDREGNLGLAHNTPHMSYAYLLPGQQVVCGAAV